MNASGPFVAAARMHLLSYGLRQTRLVSVLLVPAALATVAVLLQRSSGAAVPMARLLTGAGLSSLWGSLLATAMFSLRRERDWFGTLPLISVVPTPIPVVLGGYLAAEAVLCLGAVVVGLVTGCLWLGAVPAGVSWGLLVPGVVLTALVAAASVTPLIPLVMRWPVLTQSINGLEYPMVILAGFLVPVSALPDAVRPVSVLLPPYWALEAVGAAATGGGFTHVAGDWALAVLTACGYAAASLAAVVRVQSALRADGGLAR
ncbi:hypothetical protein ACFYZ8_20135 [Streptomyces sp. NPDC001668]|uniref:hypothetical protein n=1 Tax=unclassified Streptomyces TaxID=2593676 RepID=UPI003407FB24